MTTARRRARAAAARPAVEDAPTSFDWRHPMYGIERWPPGPDNPVSIHAMCEAKRRAREARLRWEAGASQ